MSESKNILNKVKEKFNTDKKIIILVVCSVLGMLLLLVTTGSGDLNEADDGTVEATAELLFAEYEKELTQKVKELVSSVSGAGEASVLLTLDCYEEYVYAQDEEYFEDKSETNSNIEQKKSYIIIDNDKLKLQEGVLIKIITPRVRGIGIVCSGGASAVVRQEISQILCAALDIGASKIHVTN